MYILICVYVQICIWHCAYPDFTIFDFSKVEIYAFKCLRVCKFLLFHTLNSKKDMVVKFNFDPTSVETQFYLFFHDYFEQGCGVWCLYSNLLHQRELGW
jgi:hypothetical protein